VAEGLDRLAQQLRDASSILITTHRNPDGDGLGCLLALNDVLAGADRRIALVTPGEIPARFRFLPDSQTIRNWYELGAEEKTGLLGGHDLALVVDAHELYMLDTLGDALREAQLPLAFLDHHPVRNAHPSGLYADPSASSTGELCFHLIGRMQAKPMSKQAATCLFVAITYDTNFFKYLRQRAETLRVAADLIDLGADADEIYRHVFASNSPAKVALCRDLLQRFQLAAGGRIAYLVIDTDLIKRAGAQPDDMRDLITQLLEIAGVEIAVTFKQRQDGRYKVSLRSKGRIPLSAVTDALGGGGHLFASGAHVDGSLAEVRDRVLGLIGKLLDSSPGAP
jgi:phosphoesterase RecJ-like protein